MTADVMPIRHYHSDKSNAKQIPEKKREKDSLEGATPLPLEEAGCAVAWWSFSNPLFLHARKLL
jgi:hypothetical protein